MMKNIHVVVFAVGALLFLMGCTVPQFHSCCIYTNATEGKCVLNNGTIYDTDICEMGLMSCNVTVRDEGGAESKLTLPICPDRKSGECNVSCAGIFCGRYEYDPRPLFSTSDAVKLDEEGDPAPDAERLAPGTGKDVAIGLYNSECRIEEMTPAFLNAVSNGQGLTLNVFRFGIGNSFQEFDNAYMYYPLTDKACQLNTRGSVDRYENYAIPNRMSTSGGELCDERWTLTPSSGEITTYFCNGDEAIRSSSYQDCAIRCALSNSGDSPAVDAGNAYLTERNERSLGNPFAYGINYRYMPGYGDIGPPMAWAYSYPSTDRDAYPMSLVMGRDIKSSVLPESSFEDEYSFGYEYYGAEFGRCTSFPCWISSENGGWESYVTKMGMGAFGSDVLTDYYSGTEAVTPDLKWGGNAVEEFLTVSRDPHGIYAYLLPRHSVYSGQILNGHYTLGGEWKPGAEFECTIQGGECVSGFCNTADYSRGTCQNIDNLLLDANCDCRQEGGETVCDVKKLHAVKAYDNLKDIEVAMTLGAIVEPVDGGVRMSMPAVGRVISYDPGVHIGELEGNKVQMLVLLMGGNEYPNFNQFIYSAALDDRNETLTMPQVLSEEKWAGCSAYSDCGKFYTTFVDACMPDFPDPKYGNLEVCYRLNIADQGWQSINPTTGSLDYVQSLYCEGLRDLDYGTAAGRGGTDGNSQTNHDIFCYARGTDGRCKAVANSALVILGRPVTYEVNGVDVIATAIGNCLIDDNGNLITKTYGYCDQCSFLTMAKETIVSLPEDAADPGYERGLGPRMDNKYCPTMEISTIFPPWETGALGSSPNPDYGTWAVGGVHPAGRGEESDPIRYSECTMPDGTEVGKQVAWPDYLPNGYYLKSKIESYLKRNIQPVIFAEYNLPFLGGDEGAYKGYVGDDPMLSVRVKSDGKIDASKTTSPFMAALALNKMWLLNANDENAYPDDPSYFVGAGTFLADSVMDQGPAIIVVKRLKEEDFGSAPPAGLSTEPGENIDWTLDITERRVGLLCPNCMVSVAAGYDDIGSGIPVRMYQISRMFEYTNATTGAPMWDYAYYGENASCLDEGISCDYTALGKVDIIAVKWELGGRNSHCDIENEEERFGAILSDEMEFGAKVLRRFGKPVVVTDFTILRNKVAIYDEGVRDCWTDETAKRFMVYLGQHTSDLVKSGHTGLIYSDWTSEVSGRAGTTSIRTEEGGVGGYRGEFFEGTFDAAALFSGKKEETFYSLVGVSEKCECVPCTALDNPGVCNGKFLGTGPECYGYEEGTNVRWPPNCVSQDVCIPPSSLPAYKISCNVYYNNGTEAQENYTGGEIAANPQLYPDVIASIKYGEKIPCMESSGKNISYMKMETGGYRAFPLLFRIDGNLSVDCAQPPLAAFGEACGVSLPVSERRLECVIAPNDIRINMPPLGSEIGVGVPLGGGAGIGAGIPPGGIGGIGG